MGVLGGLVHAPDHLHEHLAEYSAGGSRPLVYPGLPRLLEEESLTHDSHHDHSVHQLHHHPWRRHLRTRLGRQIFCRLLGVDLRMRNVRNRDHRLRLYSPLPRLLLQTTHPQGSSPPPRRSLSFLLSSKLFCFSTTKNMISVIVLFDSALRSRLGFIPQSANPILIKSDAFREKRSLILNSRLFS
ncbi:hypothetical protein PMAYCL1PPCAC_17148 [Pristionchus mayeri]|uniref:Uncharacterized protein n=1 Tax=Pristionchus mayeri TaxID=1317129 RepID=A0AAN5CM44_9BILA|nr:hypothetical protein PMAYCL1PPCAC_17148 [Pristionchus mayeri]